MSFIPSIPGTNRSNKTAVTPLPTFAMNNQSTNSKSRIEPMTETQTQRSGKRIGGKVATKRENRYNSVAPKFNTVASNYKTPTSSQLAKDRLYGIDGRNGSSVKLNSPPTDTLYINPFSVKGYTVTATQTTQQNDLAVNVVEFKATGFSDTVAEDNFTNIFGRVATKLAVDSNSTTNKLFTQANFKLYIDNVVALLDLWYELDSLLAWQPPTNETNNAMTVIKTFFNKSEVLETKFDIREFIRDLWIPNGIYEFIKWKNQTYRSSELPQSVLMRFCSSTMAKAIDKLDATVVSTQLKTLKSNLTNQTDTSDKLSTETRAFYVGVLNKYLKTEGRILSDLDLSCNNSVYDVDFKDLFINQIVRYDGKFYPNTSLDQKELVSFQNPENIKEALVALTGYFAGPNLDKTGLLKEVQYDNNLGTAKSNKWVCDYQADNGSYKLHTRNDFNWNITNDYNIVDNQNNAKDTSEFKVSIVPSGAQHIYIDGKTNADLCTRLTQNKMFGI